jgi:hypothetical protein
MSKLLARWGAALKAAWRWYWEIVKYPHPSDDDRHPGDW